MRKSLLLAAASASAVLAFAGTGFAADTTGKEIIVTATKRASSIQDVPFSINAQTQADIERNGSTNLEDLSRNVAGLSIQNLGPGQSQVAIRGVSAGQIVRDQPGVKEQVGVYLDESVISLSLFTPDLDLFDLSRVETLRGPQGTLFGSGSVGGTIRYITNQPDLNKYGSSIEVSGNSLTDGGTGGHIKGMVNIPMSPDKAALRIVGYATHYAGFIDALRLGGGRTEDVNDGDRAGLRATFEFRPTDYLTLTPRVVYQTVDTNGFNREDVYNLYANPFMTVPVTFKPREQFLLLPHEGMSDKLLLTDLTASIDLGGVDFTSVSSYTHRNILVSRDASALTGSVSVDLVFPAAGVLLPSNLRDTTHLKQFTEEVRLSSNGKGSFQWLIGGFYADTDRYYTQRLPTPGYDAVTMTTLGLTAAQILAIANGYPADSPYNSDLPYKIRQVAVFGEGTLNLSQKLSATLGGRYYDFKEKRRFLSGGLFSNDDDRNDKTSSSGFTPRGILSYKVDDSLRFDASASQGFRLGGVNDPLNIGLCTLADIAIFGGFQSYHDETSWDYEAGFKFARPNFSLSAAAYYNQITDLQVTLDAGSCSSRISFNVPKAHAQGLEAELAVTPVKGLELSLAGSVVTSEFDSTVVDGSLAVIGGVKKGNRLASVPDYQFAASAGWYFPLGTGVEGFFNTSFQTIGSRYTQPSDQVTGAGNFVSGLAFGGAPGTGVTALNLKLRPYTTLNLNAGVQSAHWHFIGFVNNVTDEDAKLAFDRERGGRARLGFHVTTPRMFGLTVRREY
jgi:iron complex outermembrane receptor protein